MYDLVEQMHLKFGIPPDQSAKNMLFRQVAMMEELAEFGAAVLKGNRHDQLDALVDLVVFAFGTAQQLGFTEKQFVGAFTEVMRANLEKELADPSGNNSKRGHGLDLVKPKGWTPPNLEPFL
jgi:predicted HAD superfamily Cof-like phosphohydrolase